MTNEIQSQRPKEIDAEILRFQNNYEKWISIVGLVNKKPYEIYTGLADDFWIPVSIREGKIIEKKLEDNVTRYDFQFKDENEYKITMEGLSKSFNKEYWNHSKFVSSLLKNNVSLEAIASSLKNITFEVDSLENWKKAITATLEYYMKK